MSKTARRLFKNQGRASAAASDAEFESDGYLSDGSVLSIDDSPGTPPGVEIDMAEELRTALDGLLEKRASTREDALEKLIRLLGNHYLADEVDPLLDTVQDYVLKAARRDKSAAENTLAAKALGLYFLTIGPDHESRFVDVRDALLDLITKTTAGRSEPVRAALVDVLTLACFVAGSTEHTRDLLLALDELAAGTFKFLCARAEASGSAAAAAAAAAQASSTSGVAKTRLATAGSASNTLTGARFLPNLLACIGVLASTAPRSVMDTVVTRSLPVYLQILESGVIGAETKILAAENLAIFVECGALASDAPELEPATALLQALTGNGGSASGAGLDVASVKSVAQRDRKAQRAAFRDVLAFLDAGDAPHLKLKFRKENVVLQTWAHLRQLYLIRASLGAAVHVHFLRNPLLRDIFGFSLAEDAGLSRAERRALYSQSGEIARSRTQHLQKQRSIRANKIGGYFGDD
ncbi:Interferon- developmental regulator 1 [Blastocladiella emersonii ATCC 22665]|nr:Interferon- developmental regulator 1 [Blastocladiella emersonii ATCC 22665]